MKKSLSLILAIAMVFGMFASVAFAAEAPKAPTTPQEIFDVLKSKGIFEGIDDQGSAGLDQDQTRAQVAKIIAKLLVLPEDASAATYTDLDGAGWAAGFIGAATKAGILDGVGDGKFDPSGKFTTEQLAKVLVVALKLDQSSDAVEGTVSDWAKGYVAAALKAKLIPAASDYTAPALRELLVTASFEAWKQIEAAKVPVQSVEVKPIGVKKLEVKFAAPIDDSKATFEVKKNSGVVNVSSKSVSEDKKTVVLETTVKLTKGDYTVAINNVFEAAKTVTVTVDSDEKVAKIELLSDTAASVFNATYTQIDKATISYKLSNQYDEDVTSNDSWVTWNTTLGTASWTKGVLTLTYPFVKDQTVAVTGYNGAVVTTKQIKIGDKSVTSSITVKELFQKDKKELKTNSTFSDFALLLEAKDQYGNAIKAAQLKNDVQVFSSNPTVANINKADFSDSLGANGDKLGITLTDPTGKATDSNFDGKANITFVPVFGGAQTSYEINVVKAPIVDSVTLSAPTTVVGTSETVDVPFAAVDQYGAEIKKYDDLNGKVMLGSGLAWSKNEYTGDAVLKFTAPATKGIFVLMATAPKTAKTSTVQVEIKDAKVPTTVALVKDIKTALAVGADTTIKGENVVIYDQYGLEYSLDKFYGSYTVRVTVGDTTEVSLNSGLTADLVAKGTAVTVKANAKGNQKVAFEIVGVANSTYEANYKVVEKADISDYAVADVAKIYAASTHTVDVDVTGVLSDGTKVVLPLSQYTVTASVYGTAVTGKTIDASAVTFTSNETEKKGIAVVVVDGKDGSISKDIVVTNVKPVITTLSVEGTTDVEVKDNVALVSVANATPAKLAAIFKAKDQYGKTIIIDNPFLTFTNKSDAATGTGHTTLSLNNGVVGGTASISGAEAGDNFKVTLVTQNGLLSTVKVIVK